MSDSGRTTVLDPGIEAAVRRSFANQGLMTLLGARIAAIEPGRVTIDLGWADRIGQQQGFFHGGAIGAIGDVAGGYASLTLMPAGSEVMTVEYKINFLRPALGDRLSAVGQVMRAGRSITVCRVDVHAVKGEVTTLIAALQGSFVRVAATA